MSSDRMRGRKPLARSRISLATALVLYGANAFAHTAVSPNARSEYVVAPQDAVVGQAGAMLVHDYGAFKLWRIAPGTERASINGARRVGSAIALPGGVRDPVTTPIPASRGKEPAVGGNGPSLHLVQFVGPLLPEWLQQVRATGATPVQYLDGNAYLVLADEASGQALSSLVRSGEPFRYLGPVEPESKLAHNLQRVLEQRPGAELDITVVLADHAGAMQRRAQIEALGTPLGGWMDLKGMHSVGLRVQPSAIAGITAFGDVMSVNVRGERKRMDEVQTQIMAGALNVAQTGPSAPGYLAWLTGLGFSTDAADYPRISIADDGIGNGTTTNGAGDERLRVNGTGASRVVYAVTCDGADAEGEGHGHINATIAAGYEPNSAAPFATDGDGYLRGQGVNPFANVANFDIFGSGGPANCGTGDTGLINSQQAQNIGISSNSWGYIIPPFNFPQTDYIDASRAYDLGVRDAGAGAGLQPMMIVFAAGNDGSDGVASPGNSKNVLTVGASENPRPDDEDGPWTDGCGAGPTDADSAMDVADFSSLGPAVGNRLKPELIAPGVHIQGSASTAPDYASTPEANVSVCDKYRPSGQTEFAASTGTSHSTPAVSGAASLYHAFLEDELGAAPSPAMLKGYMIAHPVYLTGVGANDDLPSFAQGYGMPNLSDAFDDGTDRFLEDQNAGQIFTAAGQSRSWFGAVTDPAEPVRVVLVWTDAAGAADAPVPSVNNLDLVVSVNGTDYIGNVFDSEWSDTGGSADALNNVEAVFLPPGTTGGLEITVTATGVSGDAIPGGAALDQDYALIVVNGSQTPTFTVDASPTSVQACGNSGAEWDVEVDAVNGYTGTVNLSATSLPGWAVPTFVPTSGAADPGFVSELSVTTAGGTDGAYPFTVEGNDGLVTRSDSVTLLYSSVAPAASTPTAPADDATGQPLVPTLTWSAVPGAVNYVVEVATDAGFTNIVDSATVTGASYQLLVTLEYQTEYFWRVRTNNNCGDGPDSAVNSFTTVELPAVLLVDDDNDAPSVRATYITAVEAIYGVGNYAIVDTAVDGEPSQALLDQFDRVIWFSGDVFGSGDDEDPLAGPTPDSETALASWLDGGACLFLSSQDYYFDSNETVTSFMSGYLGVNTMSNDVSNRYTSVAGQNVYSGLGGVLSFPTGFANWIDYVTPAATTGVQQAFRGSAGAGNNQGAAVSKQAASYFTTFLAFPLENLPAAQRQQTLQKFDDTCGDVLTPPAVEAFADAYDGTEDTTLTVNAANGVLDNDTTQGTDPLTADLVDDTDTGTLTLNDDGSFTFVPDGNVCGVETFTYTATDGTDTSEAATVTLDIDCVNDAPVAQDDAYSTAEGVPLSVTTPQGVLVNDDDVENSALTAAIVAAPANGVALLATDGSFNYLPGVGFCGEDSFTYRANDGTANSAPATVEITVQCDNEAPVAGNLPDVTLLYGQPASINGAQGYSDPDGDTMEYSATGLPASLTINPATGMITGTPTQAQVGVYTVTVTAEDPDNETASDSFTLTVAGPAVFANGFE